MREILWLLAIVSVLGLLSASVALPPERGLSLGMGVVGAGALLGVPTGFYYHVLLYRALRPLQLLPPGWIWSPLQLNAKVPEPARARVELYCRLGAIGFGVMVLGLLAMGSTVVVSLLRQRAQHAELHNSLKQDLPHPAQWA